MDFVRDLDKPLVRLSRFDALSTRDCVGGIHWWAMNGGGKSSDCANVGMRIVARWLWGLCDGSETWVVDQWVNYAHQHGRANSVILLDENESFNFIEYEISRHGLEGIGTVVEYLMRVVDASRRASGTATQRGGEVFWEDTAGTLFRYTLPLIYSAEGTLTIPDILRFITTAATSRTGREHHLAAKLFHVRDGEARRRLSEDSAVGRSFAQAG